MCGCAWPTIRHGRAKTKLRESGVDAPRTAVAQLLTTVIVSVFAHAHPLPVISAVVLPAAHERNFLGYYSDCFIYVSSCCCRFLFPTFVRYKSIQPRLRRPMPVAYCFSLAFH